MVTMIELHSTLKQAGLFNNSNETDLMETFDNLKDLKRYMKRIFDIKITILDNKSVPYNLIMINFNDLSGTWLKLKYKEKELI